MPRRRRRRSSGEDVFAAVLVVGGVAIALAGIYLVVGAAAAVVAWLARLALRPSATRAAAPKLVPASAPSQLPPPESEFRAIQPVDAAVFTDGTLAEAAALKVFSAWVSKLPKGPRDASDFVRSIELRTRMVGRLATRIEGRRFVWRNAPYTRRMATGRPPLDPAVLDPWSPPPGLRDASRHVTPCATCAACGRVTCDACDGSGRRRCDACDGAGKRTGYTANGARRLLNCTSCRGRGNVVCSACTRGRTDCPTCHRSKRLEVWLEVDTSMRVDARTAPDGEAMRAFPWGQPGRAAERAELAADAAILDEVTGPGPMAAASLPRLLPAGWGQEHWHRVQPQLGAGERVTSHAFAVLELPAIEIAYGLAAEQQSVSLEGLRMLAPPLSTDHVFRQRAQSLARLSYVAAALPLVVGLTYLMRGPYFHTAATACVALSAAMVGALVYAVAWHASLGRVAARKWLAAALLPVGFGTGLAIAAEPRLDDVRRLVAAGDLKRARVALQALGSERDPRLAPLWAEIRLDEVLAETDADRAANRAQEIPASAPQAAQALERVDTLYAARAKQANEAGDFKAAKAALAALSPGTRDAAAERQLEETVVLAEGTRCLKAEDWTCALDDSRRAGELGLAPEAVQLHDAVVAALLQRAAAKTTAASSTKDLEARLAAEAGADKAWVEYLAVVPGEPPAALVALRRQHDRDAAALARQKEAEEQRRRAAEKRQLELRAAEEERQRRTPTVLMCCDGSASPSCGCGGSHRGCCSHHGGVCGCR